MKSRLIFLMIALIVLGCENTINTKKSKQTYIVKPEAMQKRFYFTGTIQPLQESAVATPMDAVIETMHFPYGQQVKKGEVVLTLISPAQEKQYNETVTEYLKAKDSFAVAKAKFTGTQELWQAGLLSKNNFLSEKSNLATARVSFIQTTRKLTELLKKMDDDNAYDLATLNLAEFDKVRQVLNSQHNLIRLKAPADGVLLYPPKTNNEQTVKLGVGSMVKAGQVLALVGDLTGIRIEIAIPEVEINQMHPGMAATITGIALGQQVLKGNLVAINEQAAADANNALPSFNALIEVKALNDIQRRLVKVGMSAAIAVETDEENQLLIPISAIKHEKGKSVVTLKEKDGSLKDRIITTKTALADKVVVASGLKAGDVLAYD